MAVFSYDPGGLILSDFPVMTRTVTLASGQNLTRGALLGQITVGGNYTLSLAAAGDGSETPTAILAHDVDASAGDVVCQAYFAGEFADDQISYGTGHTAVSADAAFAAAAAPIAIKVRA
ncbi:MAG: head decoration protein [Pseudomonadota bacterium]